MNTISNIEDTSASLRSVITGAAFCPHPPLLVPEVARGAAPELHGLRSACREAIRRIASSAPRVVVIGPGPVTRFHEARTRGSLAGFGVPLEIPLGSDEPGPVELPLSLTVAAWLIRDALGHDSGAVGYSIGPADDRGPGPLLPAGDDGDFALLVMGDGSARRSTAAPGYLDERAAGFDAAVADGLASGAGTQLQLDGSLAADLLASGGPAWQVAAAALGPADYDAELLYDDAPYGVGYFVAVWTQRA